MLSLSSHSDAFAKLLESGDLSMNSIKVDGISMSFQNLLAKICFYHHFSGKQCHSDIALGGFIPEITEATLLPLVSPFLHQALGCSPECLLSMGPAPVSWQSWLERAWQGAGS